MTLTRALSSAVRSAEVKGVADDGDGELGAGDGEAGGGGDGKVSGLDDSGAEHDVNGDGGGGLALDTTPPPYCIKQGQNLHIDIIKCHH
jgi:hypothetical protein